MTHRRATLALCLLAFFSVMTARLALSPVIPAITEHFDVTNGEVGMALTGMWAAYALLQYPSGVLGDYIGERQVILGALALVTMSALLVAVAPSFWLFLLFVVCLGASAGLYYTVATSLLTKLYENTGRAIGVHGAGGPLAGLVTPGIVAWLASRYTWRIGVLVSVAVTLPVFAAFRIVPKMPPKRPEMPIAEQFALAPIVMVLRRPSVGFVTVLSALGWFAFQATASFLPAFLVAYHGFSVPVAGIAFSVYFAVLGGTMIVGGDLSERLGRDLLLGVELLSGSIGYMLLVFARGFTSLAIGIVLVGVAMAWPVPMEARLMDSLSDEERSTVFGLVRTVYMTVGALGSFVIGMLADGQGWNVAVGLLAAMAVGMFVVVLGNRLLDVGL